MKKGLGRGVNALKENKNGDINAESAPALPGGAVEVDIRRIEPGTGQPRKYFDEGSLQELAESIKSFGVIQPLIVKDSGGFYTIIAGERRYRAARIAKLETLPVVIKEYTEMETLQVALVENIQRKDLTPIEEALCYKRLMDDFFFTSDDIAEKVGKNKHAVAGTVRLLELDERVQRLAADEKLSASHAQALLSLKNNDEQFKCAEKIIEGQMSVRAAEAYITKVIKNAEKNKKPADGQEQQIWDE
jgi:ParB family chromosome partitioning protein